MYTSEIIEMITWPLLIIISYQVIKLVLKKSEAKLEEDDQ